jgi:hypothetical protein
MVVSFENCPDCEELIPVSLNWQHITNHHPEHPPHRCRVCKKYFWTSKENLKHKQDVHATFACDQCPLKYVSAHTRRLHIRFVHFKETRPNRTTQSAHENGGNVKRIKKSWKRYRTIGTQTYSSASLDSRTMLLH